LTEDGGIWDTKSTMSMVTLLHKRGDCSTASRQEEHTRQRTSGASLYEGDWKGGTQ